MNTIKRLKSWPVVSALCLAFVLAPLSAQADKERHGNKSYQQHNPSYNKHNRQNSNKRHGNKKFNRHHSNYASQNGHIGKHHGHNHQQVRNNHYQPYVRHNYYPPRINFIDFWDDGYFSIGIRNDHIGFIYRN